MSSELPLLLRVNEACREIGCSRASLYRLLSRGELAGFKDGNRRRITRASVEGYIKRHTRRARGLHGHAEGDRAG